MIDLHTHSTFSDGELTPKNLIYHIEFVDDELIVNEAKNSIYATSFTEILKRYKDDPLNPASKELFNLLNEYAAKEAKLTDVEKIQKVLDLIKEQDIQMVDFKMIDINGQFRHVTIPANSFSADIMRDGIGFDASNYGYGIYT